MSNDDKQVLDLWQQQASDGFSLTSEQIQMNLQRLESIVRTRTRGGYQVCGFLIVAFSAWAFFEHDLLMRIGAAAIIVAIAFLAFQVYRDRFGRADTPQVALPSVEHLRNELQRQLDFHRGKRLWSRLLLLYPAGFLFLFAFARAHPEVNWIIRFEIAAFILIFLVTIPLNLRIARKYQRQIEELDRQKELS
jgi:hypothetical protein